jgi:hypothetical protein
MGLGHYLILNTAALRRAGQSDSPMVFELNNKGVREYADR